jgi:acetate kinase
MMNKKSGVMGMTGLSSDMRDIDAAYDAGNEKAIVARDMYYNRVKKFVGEYAAEMGGVDLVIFTGGVGENSADLRRYVCRNMEFMGIELNAMMNKKSGVMGMTGLSSDMRDIDAAYDAGNEKAIVARDMYYNRVKKFVGEYAAEMGGVDLVIFTGGVGENSADLRRYVCHNMEFMGIELNDAVNDVTRGVNTIISTPESKVKVAVIATNEELVIATDTYNLTKNL